MNFNIIKFDTVTSTSDEAKRLAEKGFGEGTVIVSSVQTCGRGRGDHSFESPRGGLYFSLILYPESDIISYLTPMAAVAAVRCLAPYTEKRLYIKWVNDIYTDEGKIAGILAERSSDRVVLGVGIDLVRPYGVDVAAGLFDREKPGYGDVILWQFLKAFDGLYRASDKGSFIDEYRKRAYLSGKRITVWGKEAQYLGVDDEFRLLARFDDGRTEAVDSGEVGVIKVY